MIDLPSLTLQEFEKSTGQGVRVLVADSGVEKGHPEVHGEPIDCYCIESTPDQEMRVVTDSGIDVYGHGTAVAGIIRKMSPGARIDSLRVLGYDLRATSKHVLSGMEWAIKQGYDIVNCSFGTSDIAFLPEYKRLVDLAFCANCLLIGACNNQDFREADYPSSFPTVIATDHGKLEATQIRRRRGQLVEFIARGEEIRVAWKDGSYRTGTGSSYAAPHLAALVARIRQCRPLWNACEIKSALYRLCVVGEQ